MKQSELFFKTRKETPSDADSINASYLIRAGFVEKQMAGAYAYLPLGLRVLRKIEQIVREEMNAIGGQEVLLNVLQPKELWQKTGRWDSMGEVLYKCGEGSNQVALAATHEEQITWIVKNMISSYKDLPKALYQIQTKFRNEPRAKSGLLRGREFQMKDMYSFHTSQEDFRDYYRKCIEAYLKIFKRLGMKVVVAEASGGEFTKEHSHEFQLLTPVGEDIVYYCEKCDFAQNKEIAEVKENDKCPKCGGAIRQAKGIEVANIFPLESKYSSQLGARYVDVNGAEKDIIMGCYGFGVSRNLAAAVEVFYDSAKNKMTWPEEIAPFQTHIISLNKNAESQRLYEQLLQAGDDVLLDDRDVSAGEKFAEADLIGCFRRVIVSEKSLTAGGYEVTIAGGEKEIISPEEMANQKNAK